jgi:diaminohydroxyphosphoribosylaminopyrimidine deaminase/5-amino-6-(5-phosphoribosylamino)uracil reductase
MMKHDHQTDERFMQRALELALLGRGHVSPNPLVGCVVVHNDRIVGEGWHKQFGGPHAEVNAINSVLDKTLLPECTVHVSLEPCSHFGKTPPCSDLLIGHRVRKVVVANVDSNPLVGGTGLGKLREAGIEVVSGILDKQGRDLNKRFFTFMESRRPYIILKWAETADGFISRKNYDSRWVTNEYSRQLVHRWRTEEDAFLVGSRTAQYDNPRLNVRDWSGRNPTRILIDRFLRVSEKQHLFDGTQRTLVYNVLKHEELHNLSLIRIDEENFLTNLVNDLYQQKIQSVVVEGGGQTLQAFIDAGLWDEARIFVSPQTFKGGVAAPRLSGLRRTDEQIGSDWLTVYINAEEVTRSGN